MNMKQSTPSLKTITNCSKNYSNAETVAMNLDPRSIAHIFLTFLWLTKDFSKSKTGGFLRGRSESAVDILKAIENGHAKT